MCLYPKLIKNRKYVANKKNGGRVPPVSDIRVTLVAVGCGKCIECAKQKARAWQVRLNEEVRADRTGTFVTLTFNEDKLKELEDDLELTCNDYYIHANNIATLAIRRFLERWRKKYKTSVKHWLITELGHTGTERIHLHGLIFTENKQDIKNIWGYGYVYMGYFVTEQTVNYITKYINKIDLDHKNYKPKVLCSKGIGSRYIDRYDSSLNKYKGLKTNELYKTRSGTTLNLPIYYRNKIYDDEEREKLWLNKLDKGERWVCGERISVSESEEEYNKTLEYYRRINRQLGYGDDSKNWDEQQYKLMQSRLKKRKQDGKLRELIVKNDKEDLDNSNNEFKFDEVLRRNNDFLKWDL